MDQPERVRYFDNQFLRVEDFTAEQTYHRDMRRRHNRMLHTPGISEGLLLTPDGTGVLISAGAAIAPGTDDNLGGAEIVLATGERRELSPYAVNAPVWVTIAFKDEESRLRNDAGVTDTTRWREVTEIELFTSDPTASPPVDATQKLRVLLGKVLRGGASGKDVVGIDGGGRRIAGSAESELSLTPRIPTVQEPDWVRLRWIARGQAELRGSLKLVAGQSAPGDLSVAGAATVAGALTVSGLTRGSALESTSSIRGRTLRVDTAAGDTSTDIGPATLSFHAPGTQPSTDPRLFSDARSQLTISAPPGINALGILNVGQRTARTALNVFGNVLLERSTVTMGRTDGTFAAANEVIGALGFLGPGVQHGQLSFRAGAGFELVDRSADGAITMDYAPGSKPYADLRARDVIASGALRPSAGNSQAAGIQFPLDPGGGGGDEAFIRYFAEAGETTKLLIGTGNDFDDRVSFWQAGAERMTIYNGGIGIGTTTPAVALHVIGNAMVANNLTVGAGGNGVITVRHVNGKRPDGDAPDPLYLNWDNGRPVQIGGGARSELHVAGNIYADGGDLVLTGRVGTNGLTPAPLKAGWGGGIHTWDVEAEGTVWSRSGYQSGPRDLAENFACDVVFDPGDVVALDPERDIVVLSCEPNDPHVLGVVSERPAVLLGATRDADDDELVVPVGLAGRVPCKVLGPVARGDLLTASGEPGHAMRAVAVDVGGLEVFRPGTILGKALEGCTAERGVIDIIVLSR